ncbi:hypothetical protein [Thalassobellus suaedae]|uniref:Uncharacterized protein n=1 Tax=Thalassobellus suaedae TaxID=3074124 RepID=A0ABY9XW67_9FLAO|nr:hypothetical protein RHP51_04680 [Flavobacteriaceae bacterium HL-DH14]
MKDKNLTKLAETYKKHLPQEAFSCLQDDLEKLKKESEEAKREMQSYINNLNTDDIIYLKKNLSLS